MRQIHPAARHPSNYGATARSVGDSESTCLVALTDRNGSFIVSLDGKVAAHLPDISLASPPSHGDFGSSYTGSLGWSCAPKHRTFYRWLDGSGIEERALATALPA